jgi:predicted AAA+ superfamily ATPase
MLLMLTYPVGQSTLPLQPNFRKSPKLQMFDTGLVNYISGIQAEVFDSKDLSDVYRGRIAEHIIGQELLSVETSVLAKLHFWTREQRNSQAEIDFILPINGKLIPVEVKSGASGKLKSLHLFMDQARHDLAVRFWSGKSKIEKINAANRSPYTLINLPYYHAGTLTRILQQVGSAG